MVVPYPMLFILEFESQEELGTSLTHGRGCILGARSLRFQRLRALSDESRLMSNVFRTVYIVNTAYSADPYVATADWSTALFSFLVLHLSVQRYSWFLDCSMVSSYIYRSIPSLCVTMALRPFPFCSRTRLGLLRRAQQGRVLLSISS